MSQMSRTILAAAVTIYDITYLGSVYSLRSVYRGGSSMSVFETVDLGHGVCSSLDSTRMGSSLSLRALAKFGSAVSIYSKLLLSGKTDGSIGGGGFSSYGNLEFGSMISLRGFVKMGSLYS